MNLWAVAGSAAMLLAAAAPTQDASEGLAKAADRAQEWDSYSFKIQTQVEGLGGGGGGGGGNQPRNVDGDFVKGKGLHSKAGSSEAIREGDKVAVKGSDGQWKAPAAGGGRPGGGGGGGGGQGGRRPGGGGGGSGFGEEQLLAGLTAPHLDLVDAEKDFRGVDKGSDGGSTTYSGELTSEGATKLLGPTARRFTRGGGGQVSGRGKIWVNGEGEIVKVEVEATVKGSFQGRDFEVKIRKTIEISRHGKASFDVPEEAKKILGG